MGIIIDVVIIGIILLCVYGGYKKGLIGLAFSIASFLVALVIAFILFTPISTYVINNTEFDDNIKESIINNFNSEDTTDKGESNFIVNYVEEQIDEARGKTLEIVASEIAVISIKGIVFMALFIVAKIALSFVKVLADLIAKLPILKQFNDLGGIVFGLLKGLVITYGALAILLLVSPMFNDTKFFKELNSSFVGGMMYNNNFIVKMIF